MTIQWSKIKWKPRFENPLFPGDSIRCVESLTTRQAFFEAVRCVSAESESADFVRVIFFLQPEIQEFLVNIKDGNFERNSAALQHAISECHALESIARNVRMQRNSSDLEMESFFYDQYGDWYQLYLGTSHWKEKRRLAFKTHGTECTFCEQSATECHHRSYRNLGCENINTDLRPVCRDCHGSLHKIHGSNRPVIPPSEAESILIKEGFIRELTTELKQQ